MSGPISQAVGQRRQIDSHSKPTNREIVSCQIKLYFIRYAIFSLHNLTYIFMDEKRID